jgi:hypothetical protein
MPAQDIEHFKWSLTDESQAYLTAGSPEAQVFNAVPAEGLTLAELKVGRGAAAAWLRRSKTPCSPAADEQPPRRPLQSLERGARMRATNPAASWPSQPAAPPPAAPQRAPPSPARRAAPPTAHRAPLPRAQAAVPGEAGDVGFKQAMQQRWLALDKSSGEPRVVRKVESIEDKTRDLLQAVADGQEVRGRRQAGRRWRSGRWGQCRCCTSACSWALGLPERAPQGAPAAGGSLRWGPEGRLPPGAAPAPAAPAAG